MSNAKLRLGPKDWDAPQEGDEEPEEDLVSTTLTTIVRREDGRGDVDSPPSSKR